MCYAYMLNVPGSTVNLVLCFLVSHPCVGSSRPNMDSSCRFLWALGSGVI